MAVSLANLRSFRRTKKHHKSGHVVRYLSDFHKQRTPPSSQPETPEDEHLESKPSPKALDPENRNHHHNCSGTV